jgi:3-hydroxymyristoyl/3-hydroxydecanoyl-(acyl carrier protein) dehydratase
MKRDFAIAKDHPAYEGHFPGHPLLPGVVLIAEAMAALDASHWTVVSAKFLSPVEPGMALTLSHAAKDPRTIDFEIASPRGTVATGTLSES